MTSRLCRVALASALLFSFACGGDDGAGAGGDDTVPVSEYAASVCTEVGSWFETIQAETEALQTETADIEGDLEGAKESVQAYLDDVIRATENLLDGVGDAGQPDVDEGSEVAAELQSGFQRVLEEFERAREEIEAVGTDDPEAFVTEFQRIGGRLQDGSALEEAFGGLERFNENQELEQAFEEEPACEEIG